MKNRERLLKMNEYDLLKHMQSMLVSYQYCPVEYVPYRRAHGMKFCILDLMRNSAYHSQIECNENCSICIQKWLNAENE